MRLAKLEWSHCFWRSLLSVSPGTKLPLILNVGHVLSFLIIDPILCSLILLKKSILHLGVSARFMISLYMYIESIRFSITAFVKMVVDKSKGKATELELPMCGTEAALRYVADACPLLRALTFVDDLVIFKHSQILPEVIGKWKFLEKFFLGGSLILTVEHVNDGRYFCKYFQELLAPETPSCYNVLERIIVQIGTHCKQFRFLNLILIHLLQVEALAIVNFLPHLRTILAGRCIMERDSVLTVVRGCKELDIFYAKECAGFAQDDEEIYKLARQTVFT
ncbi:PREDICTED: uncharacterized protein LOC101314349 [Fragaria vesca subsp. vesca]|uniref:uncharacterized protein LOC101314349 n=1 Tax=Fragaria vesca subsp. vesca TaxID=101020 RepID=UPI0002C2FF81|nr:PREDICTED: uncharacterized protein LOC101314349 [Fragaria vesca subsp. vesca]